MNEKIKSFAQTLLTREWDKEHLEQAKDDILSAILLNNQHVINSVKEEIIKSDNECVIDNASYNFRIQELVKGIEQFRQGLFSVKVIISDEINAFAYPDGSIRVYSGLMDFMDDEELVGVIGHEMGHVVHQDYLKAWKQSCEVEAVKNVVDAMPTKTGIGGYLKKKADSVMAHYLQKCYSRAQEYRADKYSIDVVKQCGYNPYCVVRFLEKFVEMDAGNKKYLIERMFATHPDSDKRAERIRKMIEKGKC